jgi:xylan 1,4-beta-xylosidase
MRFRNPIIPGFYPDPSICRVGKDYYLVNSSFEYFPGIPIFHSTDLISWQQIGHCITRTEQIDFSKTHLVGGIFAPTIRYNQGIFYVISTMVDIQKHFIVTATDPVGEWSNPIWIDQDGIDPSLAFLHDNSALLTWAMNFNGSPSIMQSAIDLETGNLTSPVKGIWTGTGGASPEGPHLYQIFDRYYLMIAEGGTEYGHMVTIARSDSPWGPFESYPHNPILSHRSLNHPIQATGHADLIQAHNGTWWSVMLGIRPVGYPPCYHIGRETFLAPVTWNDDKWPILGNEGRIELEMDAPAFADTQISTKTLRDDFDQSILPHYWNFIRTPHHTDWSITERQGWLFLRCVPQTLDDPVPAFVGRRQQHLNCDARVLMDFEPQQEGDEAGMTAIMNAHHHYEIAVIQQNGKRSLIARRRIGSLHAIVAQQELPDGPVELSIHATPTTYTFSWLSLSGQRQMLAECETRYLSTEVAGGFTGVYFGMYATANGEQTNSAAYFDWFEYTPTIS